MRKEAGWGEESKSTDPPKKRRESKAAAAAAPTLPTKPQQSRKHYDDDGNDDIMIIPDLDEDLQEDLQLKVAEAPQNVRVVQSLRELDSQISGLQVLNQEESRLDLSILTSVLVPRDKLIEPDEPWEFGQLLEQVSQAMTKQKETDEEFERTISANS